jgi:tRNA 2-selenouridine synthase
MALISISAQDALTRLNQFDTLIDARSEGEYALDRLPGALNWPTLSDDERKLVGTEYKQISAFDAKKRGAALAARNIAAHIEAHVMDKPKNWKPLVYCWRGGKRSGSLSLVLAQIGFEVHIIEGGYKAFRAVMLADLERLAAQFSYRAVCGPTGSGKTRLLQSLESAGAQVLDLEALAQHRSSVLGLIPGQPQPTQKQFEMRVWNALRQFDAARPVIVESESKKVGNVSIPDTLMLHMRASPCARIDLPASERVALLMEDYDFFVKDRDFFCKRLDTLRDLRGHELINAWQAVVNTGSETDIARVVHELLETHYDPGYLTSTRRNFKQFDQALPIASENRAQLADTDFARNILDQLV